MTNTIELETQLNAVLGFVLWLKSQSPTFVGNVEFAEQLTHVLQVFGWELNRQIDCDSATQDWFTLVGTTSILAAMLLDELLEVNPGLRTYRPADEPQTVQEMMARLLADALSLFEQSQKDMAEYLEKPVVPDVLNEFIQRVVTAPQ